MTSGPRPQQPVNLQAALARLDGHWLPARVAALNDYDVKVVRILGEFTWHTHEETDELFLVLSGRLTMQLRGGDVELGPGELYVVPRGVEHCPRAAEETAALLIEPRGVVNTGDAGGPLTAAVRDLS
jgi:mannose-6-phosphate isomerase-like protein (cupin superfamily)